MNISVFGLGYVGAVSCACLAKMGHCVTGVDINRAKVELINTGRSPIIEDKVEEFIRETLSSGRLRATTSAEEAVLASDVSLICVGTPSKPNGDLVPLRRIKLPCLWLVIRGGGAMPYQRSVDRIPTPQRKIHAPIEGLRRRLPPRVPRGIHQYILVPGCGGFNVVSLEPVRVLLVS